LRELGKSLESLPADPSPQRVHKLRTAARRVEAIAAVFAAAHPGKSRRLAKAIEPVRKAAGDVRDMDVLAAHARTLARSCAGASLTHLLAYLELAREHGCQELLRVLRRRRKTALAALKEYYRELRSAMKRAKSSARSRTLASQNQEKIHGAAMSVVRELGQWPPLDAANLHAFRLKVKNLRYTLQLDENADPGLVAALGDVQRRAGDWHDWQQLAEIAHAVLVLEQDQPLVGRIDLTVQRRFDRALAAAHALKGKYLAMPPALGA
jgi:CHAD domain-containing protein